MEGGGGYSKQRVDAVAKRQILKSGKHDNWWNGKELVGLDKGRIITFKCLIRYFKILSLSLSFIRA